MGGDGTAIRCEELDRLIEARPRLDRAAARREADTCLAAWHGVAGEAWPGEAGRARPGVLGSARWGEARCGRRRADPTSAFQRAQRDLSAACSFSARARSAACSMSASSSHSVAL